MDGKIARWFMRGTDLDAEIRERFGVTIDRAIAGGLAGWTETPSARLALVIVLDQFARHAFRGTARAYAGATRAIALCREGVERGWLDELSAEQRMMFKMPLVHAEDRRIQEESLALARRELSRTTDWFRPFAELALEQARKHHDWILEFGRFPGRNADLGRISTDAERAFLADFFQHAVPSRYRDLAPARP